MNELTVSRLLHVILYLLGFFILWEWIRPLESISDIGDSHYFVIFIVLMLILDFFSIKLLWKSLLVFLYIAFASYSLYYGSNPMFGLGWFILFIGDFINSIQAIFQLDWNDVTNSFRTFLFFILLWMMTYLLRYWLLVRRSILLFVFLSMAFVATLDTFTHYDGDWAIVRLFIFGVILLGVLRILRLTENGKIKTYITEYPRWFIPLCVLIALAISAGYFAPKPVAQWADPVPFIISTSEKFTGNDATVKTVGYDEDDSKLGGDFIPDDTVVFNALVDSKHYWFVESKNEYTGKGWEVTGSSDEFPIQSGKILTHTLPLRGEIELSEMKTDLISVVKREKQVPYPNPVYNAAIVPGVQGEEVIGNLTYIPETNKLIVDSEENFHWLASYDVMYQTPTYDINSLQAAESDQIGLYYPEPYNPESLYTQLPENLPPRIKELAEVITQDETTTYDKVKAIEDYFNSPDFTYSRTDVPYPKGDEDFVDQFLFETMRGYCDHFSTSMVVMLRTLDIPARWVKGYSSGTYVRYVDVYDKSLYQVTNNNAHSWVEVFFNDIGWVPFEPTKGYNLDLSIQYNTSTTPTSEIQTPSNEPKETQQQERPSTDAMLEQTSQAEQDKNISVSESVKNYISENWKRYIIVSAVVLLIIVLVYLLRGKWLPYIWLWRYSKSKNEDTFIRAYTALLKELNRYGIQRQFEQTLREYACRVDQHFSTTEMEKLTSYYEKIIYGNRSASAMWEEVKPLWESMMKKTIT